MSNTFVIAREFNGRISTKEQLYRTLEFDCRFYYLLVLHGGHGTSSA